MLSPISELLIQFEILSSKQNILDIFDPLGTLLKYFQSVLNITKQFPASFPDNSTDFRQCSEFYEFQQC